jgi:phosphoribosylanthranilate isomerase
VKICGITNLRDAEGAARAGADALGFVFAKSPRRVSVVQARRIIRALGPWIAAVGVFVNEDPENIRRTVDSCGLTAVQLHGDESPEVLKRLSGVKVIKAFRLMHPEDFRAVSGFEADAFLLDAKVQGVYGGTGKSFDWRMLKGKRFSKPLIISGGLSPGNVRHAVCMLSPYGVDVSSGVERSPGKKSLGLVKEFIQNAKNA